MKKIYVHPLPIRIWHWLNAAGFLVMILTGLQIRFSDLFAVLSFQGAVKIHNTLGFILMANYFIWFLYYIFSDKIKVYHPELDPKKHFRESFQQIRYYGHDIFVGGENPHHATPYDKFNPMQKMAYQVIMLLVVPLQFLSGLFLWDATLFAPAINLVGGIRIMDTIHVLLFIFFVSFLPVHFYLATLGPKPSAHFKAMFTGYEELPEKG